MELKAFYYSNGERVSLVFLFLPRRTTTPQLTSVDILDPLSKALHFEPRQTIISIAEKR
ncbi:MAG: hypothetical protein INR71_04405 [Terriglobus roseus]|nr:hypothetical protein [Terriglobus roseus]